MMRIFRSFPVLFALASVGAAPPPLAAQDEEEKAGLDISQGYILPDATVQDLFATDPNYATLDHISPDGDHFVVPLSTELSTLAEVGEETLRLGMLELRARADRPWHLDIYGLYGFRFYSLSERAYIDVDLPEGTYVSDLMWSPDGSRLAFLAHLEERTEVWIADASDGSVTPAGDARVIATIGTSSRGQGSAPSRMLQWTPSGSVLTLAAPADRGSPPPAPALPSGPTIRHTRAEATPTRTMPFLLEDEHGADLFEYYTRSQIVELAPGRSPRAVGEPGMYESLSSSPDGRHVIATRLTRPFSYIASYTSFPRVTEVIDLESGDVLATLEERELREGARGGGGTGGDPRDWTWRPDGSGISYLQRAEAEDGEDEDDDRPDRIMLRRAPFGDGDAEVVATSDDRISGVTYSADGRHAFADVRRDGDAALVHYALGGGEPEGHTLVAFHDPGDAVELPGDLLTARTGNGLEYAWVSADGTSAYLRGDGWKEDFRPQPFVDRLWIPDGATERLFEGSRDSFDRPLVPLDADLERMVVSREGKNTFPDSHLWTRDGGMENLTRNVDPFPQLTAARRIDFEFTRRDGLEIQGRVSLPVDYVDGTRVPAVFWTYPREYRSEDDFDNATIRARNHNAYTNLTWLRWSDIWLTQGYAIVYPDIPIVGENYNDYYISNMVDGMYAAIRAVDALGVVDMDRIGHGGHSYGAFATANFLAHTPFFKAGIAGDGAYNRSLTPMGFQAEPRDIWEAPHVYMEMSPFFKADQINTPLLLYHGADDNNSGTYPIQSRRMIQALTGLGKTAALFEYPFESHTPRAIENNLDMWARWIDWFDRYVKGAGKDDARTATDSP
ncbi:prolyl oligopeptidase family serine peptidase [Candidatus Palauibacter soopunensis]|uniref:alpha/beta hydrolase family protein n=2 Tax=Candidatus Palauibacter soopunensis TaxID=3056739 RepID=UPI0023A709FA|nr:prolyl oligopeptidase family serine peptidase [Candidatus Palauibacter soopunensis]MDE2878027.1 prolyl oligopeptidase family serine peptidase [Candidatus Palauibacter soopunensis]